MTKNSEGVSAGETVARFSGVALGGILGSILGPKGAVMGGIAGAAAMDATMSYIAGRPIGQVKLGQKVIQGKDPVQNVGKMAEQAALHGAVGYGISTFVVAKLGVGALATGAGAAGAAAATQDTFWNDSVTVASNAAKLAAGFGASRVASSRVEDPENEEKRKLTWTGPDQYDCYYRYYFDS